MKIETKTPPCPRIYVFFSRARFLINFHVFCQFHSSVQLFSYTELVYGCDIFCADGVVLVDPEHVKSKNGMLLYVRHQLLQIVSFYFMDRISLFLLGNSKDTLYIIPALCYRTGNGGWGGCSSQKFSMSAPKFLCIVGTSLNPGPVFTRFRRQYDRHCLQRFLGTAHWRNFDSSSPQQFFSGAITGTE